MKSPTAIQLAEDITFIFTSSENAYEQNPKQAVITVDAFVNIVKKYGFPEPDFEGRALQVTNGNKDADKEYLRKVGRAIKQARKTQGLTIAQLAERAGKDPPTVSYWESGTANLELKTILLIQKHLPVKLLNL